MNLELISRHPKMKTGRTPLLFIHGACHGAWCWENFLSFFAGHGYEAHALSLRGHGASEGRERIRTIRTAEYIADIAEAARRLSAPPVLIGHSMGGYVVQKYLETHSAPGVVLLASAPVSGFFKLLLRLAIRHPWQSLKMHATWNISALFETPALAREACFSADMPEETFLRHFARIQHQHESYYAGLEATFLDLPRPGRVTPLPMLFLGAENDALFTHAEIESTARAYRAHAELFPNMAHNMMLESEWQKVAERILAWLKESAL